MDSVSVRLCFTEEFCRLKTYILIHAFDFLSFNLWAVSITLFCIVSFLEGLEFTILAFLFVPKCASVLLS